MVQVTTNRAYRGWNASIPCWSDSVKSLEGCGDTVTNYLKDVRACVVKKGGTVPPDCINQVTTGSI